MTGVVIVLVVLTLAVGTPIGVSRARKRWHHPTRVELVGGVTLVALTGIVLLIVAVNSALHPSAAPLAHELAVAPVPPGAHLADQTADDGDVDASAYATRSYTLTSSAQDECAPVIDGYRAAGYRIDVGQQAPPDQVTDTADLCARVFAKPAGDQPPVLNMTVCRGTGDAVKCFSATLGPFDAAIRDPGAVTGRSSLDLDA